MVLFVTTRGGVSACPGVACSLHALGLLHMSCASTRYLTLQPSTRYLGLPPAGPFVQRMRSLLYLVVLLELFDGAQVGTRGGVGHSNAHSATHS